MANLNAAQKKKLREYSRRGAYCADDIARSDLAKICDLHDHETFYQNADRFLFDLHCKKMNEER